VLERSPEVAGLCRTVELDGAVFDIGGHSFHTPHEKVRRLVFDAMPMEQQRRDAWCLVGRSWIAYPFQQHFAHCRTRRYGQPAPEAWRRRQDGARR